jgi:hypothetical protein
LDRAEEEEILGLFGFNAEKKLKKANEHLAKGNYYDARMAFEEILMRDGVPSSFLDRARTGWRQARQALMEGQLEEAKRLIRAGETAAARESCIASLEQAGDDLDASEAKEILDRIDAGQTEAVRLLDGLDESAAAEQLPAEEAETEEEASADGSDELFDVLLQSLSEEQAEAYRSFGNEFQTGYLLLQEGKAKQALEHFSTVPEHITSNPYFRLENGQALMFERRYDEAFNTLERLAG